MGCAGDEALEIGRAEEWVSSWLGRRGGRGFGAVGGAREGAEQAREHVGAPTDS